MSMQADEFMALVKGGKIAEARAMIEAEKTKARYAPDTVSSVEGKPPCFTRRGKAVEIGEDRIWRLKAPLASLKKSKFRDKSRSH